MKLLQLKSRKNLVKIQSNLLKNIGNAAKSRFPNCSGDFFFEHVVYFIRQITYYINFYFEVMIQELTSSVAMSTAACF